MSKTVANLQDSVTGQLPGINLNDVTNLFTGFERVARELSSILNVQETEGRQNISLYDGVFDYAAPTDIFGTNLIDLQRQGVDRTNLNYNFKEYISDFDRTKAWLPNGNQITFEYRNGVGIIRIASTTPIPRVELDSQTDKTGWTAAGTASSLVLDNAIFYKDPGALRFTLTGSGTGTLTKTISSVDLTDYKNVGVNFLAYRTSSIANLTNIELRVGSSASNYYTNTVTAAFLGAFLLNQFDLASFDWSTATTVGSPDITKINYAQILITHSGTISNFWLGNLFISLPSPHILIYSTDEFFTAVGGNPSSTITAASDTINLTDEAFHVYETACALEIAAQQGGTLASGIIQRLREKLNGVRGYRGILIQPGLIDLYRGKNPSQSIPTVGNWYAD